MDSETLEKLRDQTYWRTRRLRVTTVERARDFVNTVHLAFAFQSRNSELPCLWHAACGERAPQMPHHTHHDPALGLVWRAKDVLPGEKKIYYGKALKKRPTMISLSLFPHFFAASGHPSLEAALQTIGRDMMGPLARRILEVLVDSPPLPTRILKEQAGGSGSRQRADFDRAMAEVQAGLLVCKVAETSQPFTFVWGRVDRWLEEEVRLAASISVEDGRREVLLRYFARVIASRLPAVQRLFGWPEAAVAETAGRLMEEGLLSDQIQVAGQKGWLCWTGAVD